MPEPKLHPGLGASHWRLAGGDPNFVMYLTCPCGEEMVLPKAYQPKLDAGELEVVCVACYWERTPAAPVDAGDNVIVATALEAGVIDVNPCFDAMAAEVDAYLAKQARRHLDN